ncbi:hypothetical protein [Candidatus Ruthturnera calyptogenae]|uniref:hypothetical protein n=1 Tax=Candidatus Ruthturnera calyptogenae TaxID=386487 RepID=UPI0003060628|nr:hypothetical protein [Candidatus Ruthturnera calyptogenae]
MLFLPCKDTEVLPNTIKLESLVELLVSFWVIFSVLSDFKIILELALVTMLEPQIVALQLFKT